MTRPVGGDGGERPPANTPLKIAIAKDGRFHYEIADAVRISRFRLSRIVRGRQTPTPDEQDRLAELLNQSRRTLFNGRL